MSESSVLIEKLEGFISKYYKNLLLKGGIYFVSIFLIFLLLFSVLEYFGQFSTTVRTVLFWLFTSINAVVFWKWIAQPLKGLYRLGKSLSYHDAAKIIGEHFSSVEDKLINLLQLQQLSDKDNALIEASIEQKIKLLKPIPFTKAINLKANKTYLKYIIAPIVILSILFVSGNKNIVLDSSARIISYNTEFIPTAPFDFIIDNPSLDVTKGDDFLLVMHIEGQEIPKKNTLIVDGKRYEMQQIKTGVFTFLFKNPQVSQPFQFEANGFNSSSNTLNVIAKPTVKNFKVDLFFPKYIKRKKEQLENIGNLQIPQGTKVKWTILTEDSETVYLRFNSTEKCQKIADKAHQFERWFVNNTNYSIVAKNEFIYGDSIVYEIITIEDAYPSIDINETSDSINNMQRFFEGYVEDDYGLKELALTIDF